MELINILFWGSWLNISYNGFFGNFIEEIIALLSLAIIGIANIIVGIKCKDKKCYLNIGLYAIWFLIIYLTQSEILGIIIGIICICPNLFFIIKEKKLSNYNHKKIIIVIISLVVIINLLSYFLPFINIIKFNKYIKSNEENCSGYYYVHPKSYQGLKGGKIIDNNGKIIMDFGINSIYTVTPVSVNGKYELIIFEIVDGKHYLVNTNEKIKFNYDWFIRSEYNKRIKKTVEEGIQNINIKNKNQYDIIYKFTE